MKADVEHYIQTSVAYQCDRVYRRCKAGLQQPLAISEQPWAPASMDFITGFPMVDRKGLVLMVVDRFSKYAVFLVARVDALLDSRCNNPLSH